VNFNPLFPILVALHRHCTSPDLRFSLRSGTTRLLALLTLKDRLRMERRKASGLTKKSLYMHSLRFIATTDDVLECNRL